MPRLTYDRAEAHALMTAADTTAAADGDPALVDLYRQLATQGIDLDECTADETLRAQLGMPPLPPTPGTTADSEQPDGGNTPRVA